MFLAREDLAGLGGGGTDGRGRLANLGLICMDLGGGSWCFWGLLGGLPLNCKRRFSYFDLVEVKTYLWIE